MTKVACRCIGSQRRTQKAGKVTALDVSLHAESGCSNVSQETKSCVKSTQTATKSDLEVVAPGLKTGVEGRRS